MKRLLAGVSLLALMSCTGGHPAYAQAVTRPGVVQTDTVYPGCPAPPTTFGTTWYVDQANGKTQANGGLGTQAAPWDSLTALVGAKISGTLQPIPGYNTMLLSTAPGWKSGGGVVKPGDRVIVMNGNYGDFDAGGLSNVGSEIINPIPVTIVAGPGQTPVLSSIGLYGVSGFVFDGFKVQSLAPTINASLIMVEDAFIAGATNTNIIFKNMTVQSDTPVNIAAMGQASMQTNERNGVYISGSHGGAGMTCVSLTASHVSGVRNGVSMFADNSLVQNNEIDHFSDDGLDYGASNIAILRNNIHDNQSNGDGSHEDAIQGQEPSGPNPPGLAYQPEVNIWIAYNRVSRKDDPALTFETYLQGIDEFDGDWTNVIVEGNQVVTSSCWGVMGESVHNGLFANNSVIDTGIAADEPGCTPEIAVGALSHEGLASTNVLVVNNIGPSIGLSYFLGGTLSHNIATGPTQPSFVTQNAAGAYTFEGWAVGAVTPSATGNGNLRDGLGQTNEFTSVVAPFDFTLKPSAPAMTAGTASGGPVTDAKGALYSVSAAGAVAP